MPTNVLYRGEWTEFGEQLRADFIVRHTADLPGGFSVVTLPKNFIRGWKVDGSEFPSEKPWGLMKAPALTLDLNFAALGSSSDLTDFRGYLQAPIVTRTGAINVDGTSEDLRSTNVVILYSDNGNGGTPDDVVFIGCQRLLPGLSTRIENIGMSNYRTSTEIMFAHVAMYTLENIPTDWVARRALNDETPATNPATAGTEWNYAYNLIYYDTGTSRIHTFRERAPDSQDFFLYDIDKMFTDHMADLMTSVYSVLLRGAITSPTFKFKGYDSAGNQADASPVFVPRYKKPDYTTSYGINTSDTSAISTLYVKGKIEDGSSNVVGGWYSSLSEASVYQWENCWDMLKKLCDTCKATIWQEDADTLQINVLPILSNDHQTSSAITLTTSDILGTSAQIDHQAGQIRAARVGVRAAGSDDRSDHETIAVGIRADEEVTAEVVLHNQIPLWDEIDYDPSDFSGELNSGYSLTIAYIDTVTTDTLYFIDTPTYDPGGSNIDLTNDDVPIMVPPRVDIRRARITDAYESGYDFSAFTPLPTTSTPADYPDEISGAVIEIQRNGCLPHVLSQYLVSEFGAGQIDKPAYYEIEVGRKATTKVKLRHMGQLIEIDPDVFLPSGESYWSELPPSLWLIGWAPDSKNGTVKLTLFGYDV